MDGGPGRRGWGLPGSPAYFPIFAGGAMVLPWLIEP